MIKYKFRTILRFLIGAGDKESLKDAIQRRKFKILSKLPHKSYGKDGLKNKLINLGIKTDDCIMVHASWRSFIGFKGSPNDVVNLLIEIVGPNGTVLMPANSDHKSIKFDVLNSPNLSGVLSKTFCSLNSVKRSCGSHFSVAATGKLASELLKGHKYSIYGFDDNSPYGKFSQIKDSKVLFLGLGNQPTKISLFHRVGFLKRFDNYFKEHFEYGDDKILIDEYGSIINSRVMIRKGLKNSDRNIISIFNKIPNENRRTTKVGHLNIVILDTHESLKVAMECAEKGLFMYAKK